MFQILKNLFPNLEPRKILVDFKRACMNAARAAFSCAEVKGCYFHLCQSLIRKVNSVGLKREFDTDTDVKKLINSMAALSFVPVNDVRKVF